MGNEVIDGSGVVEFRPGVIYTQADFNGGLPCDVIDPAVDVVFSEGVAVKSGLTLCSHSDGTVKYKDPNGNIGTLTVFAGNCYPQRVYGLVATGTTAGMKVTLY